MHKMLAFKREAVALLLLMFYFLVLDQQTQESRLQQLLLLQHLKVQAKAINSATNCLSQDKFWFETLLNGYFVEEWWNENFRISRCMFKYIVRLVDPGLAKTLDYANAYR